jgi:putative chitinase
MPELTSSQLSTIMPACRDTNSWVAPLNAAMEHFEITGVVRMAAFLAQLAHESGQLQWLAENLDYSAQRLMQVWPSRFPTLDKARIYEHNPKQLADHVYAKRLGNGDETSGDGWRYRGRGLIQLTGRSNYRAAAQGIGQPLVEQPELLEQPGVAAHSAAWFWKYRGLNELADALNGDNDTEKFQAITTQINGGVVGLKERIIFWEKAKVVLRE